MPGTGAPSSPTQPGPPGGRPASRRAERRLGRRREPANRPIGQRIEHVRRARRPSTAPDVLQPSRVKKPRCAPGRRVEAQHALRLGRAQAARTSAAPIAAPRAPGADDQPAARSTSRGRGRRRGVQPHAAEHVAVGVAGHQHDGRGSSSWSSRSCRRTGPARGRTPAGAGAGRRRRGRRRRWRRRSRAAAARAAPRPAADTSRSSIAVSRPPSAAPARAAGRAAGVLVGAAHPGGPQLRGDAAVTSASTRRIRGRRRRRASASVPGERAERDDERIHAQVDQRGRAGDQLVGVLAEADQQVGGDPVAAEDPHRLVPGRLVLGQRDGGLAGHPAARTSSSRDSTWMPMASAPASCRSVDPAQVDAAVRTAPGSAARAPPRTARRSGRGGGRRGRGRGGAGGHAPSAARRRAGPRPRRPRRAAPGSSTAWWRRRAATPRWCRSGSGRLGVADAGLHDGRGEHVGAVQPGDLLVRRRRRRWPGRRTSAGRPARASSPDAPSPSGQPRRPRRPRTGCRAPSGARRWQPSTSRRGRRRWGPRPARRRTAAPHRTPRTASSLRECRRSHVPRTCRSS